MKNTTSVVGRSTGTPGLPIAKVTIRLTSAGEFEVDLLHGERISPGRLEEFMIKVYQAVNKAKIQARKEIDSAA